MSYLSRLALRNMLNRFEFVGSIHCFLVTKTIPKNLIENCLKRAEYGAVGYATRVIREPFSVNGSTQYLSCTLFRTEKLPPFLKDGTERDIRHCYVLIAEWDNYLLIRKIGGRDFSNLLRGYVRKVESKTLMGAFLGKGSDVEKYTADAIDAARANIKRQSWEGKKLQETVSTLGSSNKVLNNLQHTTDDTKYSIIGNTSRYNVRGVKGGAEEFIRLNQGVTSKFSAPVPSNDFLDSFADILKLSDHVFTLKPSEILVNTPDILDFILAKDNPAPRLYYDRDGTKRYLPGKLEDYLDKIASLMDIEEKVIKKEVRFEIGNDLDATLTLDHDDDQFFLQSEKFQNLCLEFDDTDSENLQDLINRMQWFNITFSQPELHYAAGQLCRDNKLLGNIAGFLQMFIPDADLKAVTSEKGKPRTNAVKFPKKTLFDFVESKFTAGVDTLVVEDLGYEFADYIATKRLQKVQLFHCKAGKSHLSASAFQEVVGQAVKNLSFFSQSEAVSEKAKLWAKKYPSTKIARIRKGDKRHIAKEVRDALQATNVDREVYLMVNFLSLSALRAELNHLKAGRPAKKATLPLLWLLSGLRSSCLERGVKVYIYCKP